VCVCLCEPLGAGASAGAGTGAGAGAGAGAGEARIVTLSWDVFSGELDALETHMRAVGGLVSVPLAGEARAALGRSGLGLVLAAARSETVALDVALLATVVADDEWSVGGWMPSPSTRRR
jgi:hypothetical protein